jgi:hypothetical protein
MRIRKYQQHFCLDMCKVITKFLTNKFVSEGIPLVRTMRSIGQSGLGSVVRYITHPWQPSLIIN